MRDRIKARLKRAVGKDGRGRLYARIILRELGAMVAAAILFSSLAYVLWIGKPDLYYLYTYKLQGGGLVWFSKWIVLVLMAGSALGIFIIGAFFAVSSALNLLVLATNPHILRLQALAELQKHPSKSQ